MVDDVLSEIEEIFMTELAGRDDAHELAGRLMARFRNQFAKSSLYISQDLNFRNNQIIQMYQQGKTKRQIAYSFQLSTRRVSDILKMELRA
jgi:DNA-binding NarL/FixJ family response regulator